MLFSVCPSHVPFVVAHFTSANLPCALAMCCFVVAQMSVPIGGYPHIYSCPVAGAFACAQRVPICQCPLCCHGPLPPAILSRAFVWAGRGGKMVWHVGMGKWAGQVGMRTRNRAHGAVSAPRGDNRAPGQDVSSAPARATSITRLSVSGARKYNLCGYITRPAIYAGSQFTLGPLARWPMHACATVQCPFANIGHGLLGACCSNAALTVHVRNVLYCAVLYCTALCCIVLYCTVLYCTVLYCIQLYSILSVF